MSHLAGSDDGGYTTYVTESSPAALLGEQMYKKVLGPRLYCHKWREAPSTEGTASPVSTMGAAVPGGGSTTRPCTGPETPGRDPALRTPGWQWDCPGNVGQVRVLW